MESINAQVRIVDARDVSCFRTSRFLSRVLLRLSDMMWEEGFLGNNLLGTEGSAGQTPGPGFDENLNGKGMLYSYCGWF